GRVDSAAHGVLCSFPGTLEGACGVLTGFACIATHAGLVVAGINGGGTTINVGFHGPVLILMVAVHGSVLAAGAAAVHGRAGAVALDLDGLSLSNLLKVIGFQLCLDNVVAEDVAKLLAILLELLEVGDLLEGFVCRGKDGVW